jgi:hypothetical protein
MVYSELYIYNLTELLVNQKTLQFNKLGTITAAVLKITNHNQTLRSGAVLVRGSGSGYNMSNFMNEFDLAANKTCRPG